MATSQRVSWGIASPQTHELAELQEVVAFAEDAGFDYFFYGNEKLYPDMWAGLVAAATVSRKVWLGTFVADPYSQHPALTAAMAATLDHYSGGRALLVIGAGGAGLRELGIDRQGPAKSLGQALEIVRCLLRGELVEKDDPPFRLSAQLHFPPRPELPIWVATRGEKVMRLAARVADGVMLGTVARAKDIAAALEMVRKEATAAGRSSNLPNFSVRVDVAVEDDPQLARGALRPFVAGLLAASYPDRGFVERAGLVVPAELEEICRTRDLKLAWGSGGLVPDEFVDAFTWAGSADEVASRVAEALDLGPDNLTLAFHRAGGAVVSQAARFLDEVAPRVNALFGEGHFPPRRAEGTPTRRHFLAGHGPKGPQGGPCGAP
jgi:5,10-methylenetetrahydromethanopterin reductase